MRLRAVLATAVLALVAAGCSSEPEATSTGENGAAQAPAADAPAQAPAEQAGSAMLTELGLDGMSAVEIVDALDAVPQARPLPFGAAVNATHVSVTDGVEEVVMALPEDQFYVSIAPFADSTHECYFHNLATCQGELVEETMQFTITDESGEVLVDEQVTTGANGFAGFWLPRDIAGTIEVQYDGRTGAVDFSTDAEAPTCLTTLHLSA